MGDTGGLCGLENGAAIGKAEHARKLEDVQDPFQVPLVPGKEDRAVEHTPVEDNNDNDDEGEDRIDDLVDDEGMERNLLLSVDDNEETEWLEERDDNVERVVGDRGIRRALPNCRKTDKAATR